MYNIICFVGGKRTCIKEDYCDGQGVFIHPLFSACMGALEIFLYFDELQVPNPIGSKVKIHKLY